MVFPLNLLVLSQFLSCQPHHHPPNTLSQSLSPSLFSPQPPSIFIITVRLLSLPFFPYPSHSFTTTILSLIQLHISLPFPYESFTFLHLSLHLAYIFSLSLTHFISLVSSLFSSFFFTPSPPFISSGFSVSAPVRVEAPPFFFYTQPIIPLEAAARCTLYWCHGTAYHFHYGQRTIENGVYSSRGARHALLGVSQA